MVIYRNFRDLVKDYFTLLDLAIFKMSISLKEFFYGVNYFKQLEYPLVYHYLKLKDNETYLDIGTGKSIFPFFCQLRNKNIKTHIIDDGSIIKDCFNHYQLLRTKLGEELFSKIKIKNIDGCNTKYHTEKFDKISCISVIEHLSGDSDKNMAKEIGRLLKKNGMAILTFPINRYFIEEDGSLGVGYYQKKYNPQTILNKIIIPSGLSLKKIIYFGEVFPSLSRIYVNKIWFQKSGLLLNIFSPIFWRICYSYNGDFQIDWKPTMDKKVPGVACLVLEKL